MCTVSEEIRIETWGPFACFTRPDLKVERVTYDMMTPSAARNLVQSIYWHPGMRYEITQIVLMNPVKRMQLMRNELKSKMTASGVIAGSVRGNDLFINTEEDIMQRSSVILKDVHYCIHLKIHMTDKANPSDNIKKFVDVLTRRARKGQWYYPVYLGCKEFPAHFRLVEQDEVLPRVHRNMDLGLMLYDMDYSNMENMKPAFFMAHLDDGVMNLTGVKLYK